MSDINAAIAAAGVGGEVIFPANNYVIDDLRNPHAGQLWTCQHGAKFQRASNSTKPQIKLDADDLTLIGGDWDGNRANNSHQHTFVDGNGQKFTASDFVAHGLTSWGVAIDDGLLTLDRYTFYDTALAPVIWRATTLGPDGLIRNAPQITRGRIDRRVGYVSSGGILLQGANGKQHMGACIAQNRIIMPFGEQYDNVAIEALSGQLFAIEANSFTYGRIQISLGNCSTATVAANSGNVAYDYGIELVDTQSVTVLGNAHTGAFVRTDPASYGGIRISGSSSKNPITGNVTSAGFPIGISDVSPNPALNPKLNNL